MARVDLALERRVPERLQPAARSFLTGTPVAVPLRDASTVILLRAAEPVPGALEVFLLRRSHQMAFAGGAWVFPGGGVDPRDFDHEIGWVGPTPSEWGTLLGTDAPRARAIVCAAVRETFEESGVLLAGPTADSVVADTTGSAWEEDRRQLEAREVAFTDFLARRGLVLRTDLLRLWGTWITPVFEPKRYDTRFFVAELPVGQVTRMASTESDDLAWASTGDAIRAVVAEEWFLLPPTYASCLELYDLLTPAEALAWADQRDRTPIMPELIDQDGVAHLTLPSDVTALSAVVAAATGRGLS